MAKRRGLFCPRHLTSTVASYLVAGSRGTVLFILSVAAVCLRKNRKSLAKILGGIVVVSFLLSALGLQAFPAATFYFLPARAWELLVGALLAVMRGRVMPKKVADEVAERNNRCGRFGSHPVRRIFIR